jgi:HNH endonuclease
MSDERFWATVATTEDDWCWEWTGCVGKTGYGQLRRSGKSLYAHRYAWELTHGPLDVGQCVLHRCDNPVCVRPDHLFVGTHADNVIDKVVKGRQSRTGQPREANPNRKLSETDVAALRARRRSGEPYAELGRAFGISHTQARNVALGLQWEDQVVG